MDDTIRGKNGAFHSGQIIDSDVFTINSNFSAIEGGKTSSFAIIVVANYMVGKNFCQGSYVILKVFKNVSGNGSKSCAVSDERRDNSNSIGEYILCSSKEA